MKKTRKPIYVLIIPRFEDIYHSFYAGEITKGVNLAASRLNVNILIHIVDRQDHSTWLDDSLLDRAHVDGILFADMEDDLDVVKDAIRKGMPCMVLNNHIEEPINAIEINNKQAAFEAVSYLIKQGHTKIATITGNLSAQSAQMRLEGYKEALAKHKIVFNEKYVKHGEFLRTPARQAAERLLSLKEKPTAIFAASDVMALEVIDVAKKKKMKVPQDLSVIGFDDNPINIHSSVALATVSQPLIEMGRLGLEDLYQISLGKAKLPVKRTLQAKFLPGASIASF